MNRIGHIRFRGMIVMKIDAGSVYSVANRGKTESVKGTPSDSRDFTDAFVDCGNSSSSSGRNNDFTDITPDDLLETVNGLIRDGQMDLDETSSLVGLMGNSALSNVDGATSSSTSSQMPFDVFATIQERIAGARSRNEAETVANLQEATDALLRFQTRLTKNDVGV